MDVRKKDGSILVKSDYSKEFIKRAKMLEGVWKTPYWVFPEENEEQVRSLLMDIYGEDGTPQETVDLLVDISQMDDDDTLSLCGRILCARRGRDSQVKLGEGVILMKGGFTRCGGSAKYPRVSPEEGTVLKVKRCPMSVYERVKEMPFVSLDCSKKDASNTAQTRERLMKEKEELLLRLASIDAELEALKEE